MTVTVRNNGDFAENAVVYLYDGDPELGGIKIGEAVSSEPVPARSSAQVEAEWFVDPAERNKYDIYAVADPTLIMVFLSLMKQTIPQVLRL